MATGVSGLQEGIPMGDRSSDMLCGDIFGASPIRVQKLGNPDGMHIRKNSLHDNWDDEHGYYWYHLQQAMGRSFLNSCPCKGSKSWEKLS